MLRAKEIGEFIRISFSAETPYGRVMALVIPSNHREGV